VKRLAAVFLVAAFLSAAPASAESVPVETIAEETLGVACSASGAGGVGRVRFAFAPGAEKPGVIEYSGLFDDLERYREIGRTVRITKLEAAGDGSYLFEGVDDTIGGGAVRGHFKNAGDFEVNAYYAKNQRPMEQCVFYKLSPLKNRWAKKIVKKNAARFPAKQK